MVKKNLKGQKFSYLTVVKEVGSNKNGRTIWLCRCDCGNYHETLGKYLLDGSTTSCGCRRAKILSDTTKRQTTHNKSNTRLYRIWAAMRKRCRNINDSEYKNYGERGISICSEWDNFTTFYEWAMANGYADNLTIDRINNDGNYEPNNCRWVSYKVQANNTRANHYITYNDETLTLQEWAEKVGISEKTLISRINRYHWSIEKALETPVRPIRKWKNISA